MSNYAIFGGTLASDIPLALTPSPSGSVSWRLRSSFSSPERIGEEDLLGESPELACAVRLYRTRTGFRLQHSCTGEFHVENNGQSILSVPAAHSLPDAVLSDLLGRVMAVVLHAAGALCLHGSAARLREGVVGFLAPKGYGKSTLVSTLTNEGAELVTDDTLAIQPGPPATALPGITSVRLHGDSAALMPSNSAARHGFDGKWVFEEHDRKMTREAPLAAIYLLDPVSATENACGTARHQLSARFGAISLVAHMKLGALLGGSEAATVFSRAAAVAQTVPVYRLEVPRSLSSVAAAARDIMAWHGGLPDAASTAE